MQIESQRRALQARLAVGGERRQIDIAPGGIVRHLMQKQIDLVLRLGGVALESCCCTRSGASEETVTVPAVNGGGRCTAD